MAGYKEIFGASFSKPCGQYTALERFWKRMICTVRLKLVIGRRSLDLKSLGLVAA
jgi:hypothetical protein